MLAKYLEYNKVTTSPPDISTENTICDFKVNLLKPTTVVEKIIGKNVEWMTGLNDFFFLFFQIKKEWSDKS